MDKIKFIYLLMNILSMGSSDWKSGFPPKSHSGTQMFPFWDLPSLKLLLLLVCLKLSILSVYVFVYGKKK